MATEEVDGVGEVIVHSRRRRMRSAGDEVWPEPFIEALAVQVSVDASRTLGRLGAAQALFNVFQVCSTWRAISRSDHLWKILTRRIWTVESLLHRDTWRDEYIYQHRTASNFRSSRCAHSTIYVVPPTDNEDGLISCRRLALSDQHLAAGFSNGTVHLYHTLTGLHLSTFYPQHGRDRLGQFSCAVSGIVLSDARLVFATMDGDIHTAAVLIHSQYSLRRAYLGDVVNDGVLIDFSGCHRWWVGLCAGVPGHAFRIWNSTTEELVFVGGTLTDPEAIMGWHTLTESTTGLIGRVRVTGQGTAVACTSLRVVSFDLQNQAGVVLAEQEFRQRDILVGSFDAVNELTLIIKVRGTGSVRRVANLEEVMCRFVVRGGGGEESMGCINCGYGFICVGGVIRVWEIENNGEYLYTLREAIGEISALIADQRHVAAYSTQASIIHVWDFGA